MFDAVKALDRKSQKLKTGAQLPQFDVMLCRFIDSNAFVDLPDGIFDPLTNLISLYVCRDTHKERQRKHWFCPLSFLACKVFMQKNRSTLVFDDICLTLFCRQNNNNDLVELQSGIFDSLSSLVFL